MESKVLMFDAVDRKVGETYMRRARQLVGQQRAEWLDESRSAIRFTPDTELEFAEPEAETEAPPKASLRVLAENHLRDRKRIELYTWLFCVGAIFDFVFIGEAGRLFEFAFFLFGCGFTFYAMQVWAYNKTYGHKHPERHTRQLNKEMNRLKNMGYTE
jgi:hypothetical protein